MKHHDVYSKDDLLKAYTGKTSRYWVGRVQKLIGFQFAAQPGVIHPECEPTLWVKRLSDEVAACLRCRGDGNIAHAFVMSTILTCWALRISRAKAHDPRRPIHLRRKALRHFRRVTAALHDAITDETFDARYFTQPWEYPYSADATDGDFV